MFVQKRAGREGAARCRPRRPVSEVIMVLITAGAASLIRSQPAADRVNRCTGNSQRRENKRQRGEI